MSLHKIGVNYVGFGDFDGITNTTRLPIVSVLRTDFWDDGGLKLLRLYNEDEEDPNLGRDAASRCFKERETGRRQLSRGVTSVDNMLIALNR